MYIQITNVCNMFCSHCCFSCTNKGKTMSLDTFAKACKIAYKNKEQIKIGGGEPTLHPKFLEILLLALTWQESSNKIWIATNGSNTKLSLYLANLARRGIINCTLSQDEFHSPINPAVITAFRGNDFDGREIRATHEIINSGRAKKNKIGEVNKCCCNDMFISPIGEIFACGCQKDSFGNVNTYTIPEWYSLLKSKYNDCCSNSEFR